VPDAESLNVARDEQGRPEVYATVADQDTIASRLGNWLMPVRSVDRRITPTSSGFGGKAFSSDGDSTSSGKATTGHGMVEGPDNAPPRNR